MGGRELAPLDLGSGPQAVRMGLGDYTPQLPCPWGEAHLGGPLPQALGVLHGVGATHSSPLLVNTLPFPTWSYSLTGAS